MYMSSLLHKFKLFCQTSAVIFFATAVAHANKPETHFGELLNKEQIAQLPAQIFADGRGLPIGNGAATQGQGIFKTRCSVCHGSHGQGGSALELVGDRNLLNTEYPDKGIAVYWPYAPPLFAYVQRAMPPQKPFSLTDKENYAVIAYLLWLNKLIDKQQVVDAQFLSNLQMPNKLGFQSEYTIEPTGTADVK